MKYYLIVLKAHSGGYVNCFTFDSAIDLERHMDKYAQKYSYDHEHDYLVIYGDQLTIEMTKTHRIRKE